jgi:hypothetical protein
LLVDFHAILPGRSRYTRHIVFATPAGVKHLITWGCLARAVYKEPVIGLISIWMRSMARSSFLRCLCFGAALVLFGVGSAIAQSAKPNSSLSVEDVVKLSKDGIAEDVIITEIKKNGRPFDLSVNEIVELKKLGISDSIVKYLLDPTYTPPAPPTSPSRPENPAGPPAAPVAPTKQYPADVYAPKVPLDPGLYRLPSDPPMKVDLQILLGTQASAGLGKVLMKKGKVVAYLVGPAAKTRIKEPAPVFYLRLPAGKPIEEVVLVALDHKADRRELELGPPGPKQEIKPEARRAFDFLEVGPNLFRLTTAKLVKGEYLFFELGSAEPPKGSLGKGFDFGIDEAHK